jgi:hypothetical protein
VAEIFLFARDFPDEQFVDFKKFFWAVNKFRLTFGTRRAARPVPKKWGLLVTFLC